MFRLLHSWLLLVVLAVLCSGTAYGQDPPPPPPPEDNTVSEAEDGEYDWKAEENAARGVAAAMDPRPRDWREGLVALLGPSMEEARERGDRIANYYRTMPLLRFLDDVIDFSLQVRALHALRFAPMEEPWAIQDLERRRDKLGDRIQDVIDFFDLGWDLPDPELEPLAAASAMSRINQIAALSRNLVPRVVDLTTGDILDLGVQREVRCGLFVMRQMVRSLQD